jgi:integrase
MRIFQREWTTPSGETQRGRTYWAQYSVGGRRYYHSLRTRDKRAAELIAADHLRRAELRRAGVADPFGTAKDRPLEQHLAEFETTLRARGVVEKYVKSRMACLRALVGHAGAKKIGDLDLAKASAWLNELRESGLSARSVNVRYQAARQFGIWLVRTRRAQFDPFEGLAPLNEAEDRRHVRRALTPDEATRLLEATLARALARAGHPHPKALPERRARSERTRAKMATLGETRALIYLLAMGTGLRRGELRRLRWCDVDLERGRVTIPAASAKSRRAQAVDLHPRLVEALRATRPLVARPTATVLPPRSMPNSVTFDADLEAAGIPKLDAEGRVVDFHALRTTFISWLGMTGAHPRMAQALARHASIETTMGTYTDLRLFDMKGTVERLPLPRGATTTEARSA